MTGHLTNQWRREIEWAININLREVFMSDTSQIALIRKLYAAMGVDFLSARSHLVGRAGPWISSNTLVRATLFALHALVVRRS